MGDVIALWAVIQLLVKRVALAVAARTRRTDNTQALAPGVRAENGKASMKTPVEAGLQGIVVGTERALGVVDLAELRIQPPLLNVRQRGQGPACRIDARNIDSGVCF